MVYQFADRFPEGIRQMAEWLRAEDQGYDETIVDGIDNAPKAFIRMLRGENVGKQLVRVSEGVECGAIRRIALGWVRSVFFFGAIQ